MNKPTWKLFPLDWLLLCAAVYAALRCLQSSYGFLAQGLLLWCFLLTGLFCAAFRLPRGWLTVFGGLLLIVLGYFLFRRTLNAGILFILRSIVGRVANAYAWIGGMVSTQPPVEPVDVTPAFWLLAALLSLAVCAVVVRLHTALPAVLFCVATIVPCFFLTDTPPQTADLVLLTAALLVLCFSQGVRSRAPEEAVQATVTALVPALLIVGLTLLLFPEKNYQPPLKLEDMTAKLAELGEDIGSGLDVSDSALQEVDLRSLGPKQQRHFEALRVTVDGQPNDVLYLRGMAYEGFDGARWMLTEGARGDGSLLTHAWTTDRTAEVTIHTSTQHSALYTPSYLVAPDVPTVLDYYALNENHLRNYQFQMYLPYEDGYVFTPPDAEKLALLTQDAQENCLYLPDETRRSLQAIAAQNGLMTAASLDALVDGVVRFVQNSAVYDLSPPRVPADADFCTWFLTEAGSGYCVHFATAATAMLRAVGVPARYVEGYVTTVRAGEETVVEGRQAHAWVEVFFAGEGWRQVDPTPAGGIAGSAVPRGGEQPQNGTDDTEPDETGTASDAPTRPSDSPSESDPAQNDPTTPTASDPTDTPNAPKQPISGWVWALLGLLALAGAAILLRVLRQRHWQQLLRRSTGNRLALLFWKRYQALCRAVKTPPEAACVVLAKKAHFSQHQLSDEEIGILRQAADRQTENLRSLPLPKQLWCRYWFV